MTYQFKHKITCDECGTGHGQAAPLGFYENDDFDSKYMCEECFNASKCPIDVNEENYFEVAEALHAVLTLWHDGGRGYELLCRSEFRPGMGWSESTVEEENEYFAEIETLYEKGTNFDAMEKILDAIDEILKERES